MSAKSREASPKSPGRPEKGPKEGLEEGRKESLAAEGLLAGPPEGPSRGPKGGRRAPAKEAARAKPKEGKSAKPSKSPPAESESPKLGQALAKLEPQLPKLAEKLGLEVASCRLGTSAGKPAVKLVIDRLLSEGEAPSKSSSVTLDDCVAMSKAVSFLLDKIYPGEGPEYSLEVSSPGLDRPLATERDFRRFDGSLAKVGVVIDGRTVRRTGRLSTKEEPWRLLADGEEIAFDLSMVKSAKLVPEI
jgi:ribosome maturation factor RimP